MNQDVKRGFFRNTLLLITLILLMGLALSAEAAVSFGPAVNYPVGQSGNNLRIAVVGDFNGDGKLDMAVTNRTDGDVSILLGNGDGTFTPAGAYTIDTGITGTRPGFIVTADFNEDGKLDLAVTDSGNNLVMILLGNGDGSFQLPVSFGLGTGTGPNSIAVGDFNEDGHLDLAVANTNGNVAILLGNGTGGFAAATNVAAGTSSYSVAAGDFNGDGHLDLAVANRITPGGTVSILLGNGSGGFAAAVPYNTGINSRYVVIGDFNRDGNLDLAVANEGSFNVSILLGNGNGTFQAAVNYPAGSRPFAIATADFNGDGKTDLAITDNNDNFVYVLQGNGDGSFKAGVNFMVGKGPDGVAAADFNRDGKPDLVTANRTAGNEIFGIYNVSVLLNTTTWDVAGAFALAVNYGAHTNPNSLTAGDFNRDGIQDLAVANFNSNDVSILLGYGDGTFQTAVNYAAGTYPYHVITGDFNGDGKLDLAVANLGSGNVSILLGVGDGTFGAASNFSAGAAPVFLVAADFNVDGNLDLAVASRDYDCVAILLGTGTGSFGAPSYYPVGNAPYSIAVGDFNRDGKLDLAVANYYSFSVSILLGNGDGTFNGGGASQEHADFATGFNPIFVATGDFNRDGLTDLVTANYWSGNVSVLLGMGDGNFMPPVNYKVGGNPAALVVADINRDGKLDVAVACEASTSNKVFVLYGKGDGTFLTPTTPVTYTVGTGPDAIISGDFDRDGRPDLAVSNWTTNNVSILLNGVETVSVPTTPVGLPTPFTNIVPGQSFGFSTGGSVDTFGLAVEYQFDFKGDGTDLSAWGPPIRSNAWDTIGNYNVRARARSVTHPYVVSAWSGSLALNVDNPTITNFQINSGAAWTTNPTVTLTYTPSVSPAATHIRTSIGGAWSAWQALPVGPPHNVNLGTTNGIRYVYAQVKDAFGRLSPVAFSSIKLDTIAPTGVVQINGGATTVLNTGGSTTVRLYLAIFDARVSGAQVRYSTTAFLANDVSPSWGAFVTAADVVLTGTGTKTVWAQFMDGNGLKSGVYTASINVSNTGTSWPGPSVETITNFLINDGALYTVNPTVKLTYNVSSTSIKARYLYATAWTAWEIPSISAGKVTKFVTLSAANGPRQVYVQIMETAVPNKIVDPSQAEIILDTVAPTALLTINNGATAIRRFNTNPNYLILTILAVDTASGLDKITFFQTGTLPAAPPPSYAPDWVDFTPTATTFALDTPATGTKTVYVWIKDKAGKISSLISAPITVNP